MVQAPIFHVNGDDPEAVVFAAKIATEYRQRFGKDVVIDMFCYRRYGHNEGDDPTMTQPIMYRRVKDQPHDARTSIANASPTKAWFRSRTSTPGSNDFNRFLDTRIRRRQKLSLQQGRLARRRVVWLLVAGGR